MLARAGRFWRTIRHLRAVQFSGRLRRRLHKPRVDPAVPPPPLRAATGAWTLPARRAPSLITANRVRFLNREAALLPSGGWNDGTHAKLWLYNLHYFDDLNADSAETRRAWHEALIARWIAENPAGTGNGWEPYPLSMRIVNWTKWLAGGAPATGAMRASLAVQARFLEQDIEWHLLGNHLFANAKALVLAGLLHEGAEADRWRSKGLAILARELPEQVLPDGGNFERSPMYHALMTEDLLDLVNMAARFPGLVPDETVATWRAAVARMLAWLAGMSHPDGGIALFNDAAFGIAPAGTELQRHAAALGIPLPAAPRDGLTHWPDSGYARLARGPAVALIDMAPVGPDYLPGHAHADTLSFELSVRGARFIVNGGTSQYGNDAVREAERATAAHSTVEVDGRSSSETWHGFRVGDRARVFGVAVHDDAAAITAEASHDGYGKLPGKPVHHRRWALDGRSLTVADTVSGGTHRSVARYIVTPEVTVEAHGNGVFTLNHPQAGTVTLTAATGEAVVEPAFYAPQFGRRLSTSAIAVTLAGGRAAVTLSWD